MDIDYYVTKIVFKKDLIYNVWYAISTILKIKINFKLAVLKLEITQIRYLKLNIVYE